MEDADGNKRKDYYPITGFEDLVTDENGVLEGAGFVFEGDSSFGDAKGEMTSTKAERSEEAVVIKDDAVPLGTYTMHEQTTPDGYNELEGDVQIDVQCGSDSDVVVKATINGEETAFAKAERAAGKNEWVVKIMNTTGYELPSTGGMGTKWLYRMGVLLIFAAGAGLMVLLLRRRLA